MRHRFLFFLMILSGHLAASQIDFGMAATQGIKKHEHESIEYGANSHALVYTILKENEPINHDAISEWQNNHNIILALGFTSESEVLKKISLGHFDETLHLLGKTIKKTNKKITIRPLYEGNGNWYPWQAYYKGNTKKDYILAYKRIHTIIKKEAGGLANFDFNYNRRSTGGGVDDFIEIFPGDDLVDIVSISSYNRCGLDGKSNKAKSFADDFRPAYQEVLRITQRSIAVAEVSTTDFCGTNKIEWFKTMLNSLDSEFKRVSQVTFFFEKVKKGMASNTIDIDWGISKKERAKFNSLINSFNSQTTLHKPNQLKDATPQYTVTYPWSVNIKGEHFLAEKGNPELNKYTGEAFGATGNRLRASFTQGVLVHINDKYSIGPYMSVSTINSDNKNQWWNNNSSLKLEVKACTKADFKWGRSCFTGGVDKIFYTKQTAAPGDNEARFFLGFESNFGGEFVW